MPAALTVLRRALLAVAVLASAAHAGDWGDFATISSTMGVNAQRLCLGEGLRVSDIGCPAYAPYVTPAGWVGIGSTSPNAKLDVNGTISASDIIQVGQNPSIACSSQIRGSIRYNASAKSLDVCDGGTWASLSSNTAAGITGTGSSTAVAFWNGANSLSYDGGLYWDNTNKRLGIGTTAPNRPLEISGTAQVSGSTAAYFFIDRSGSGAGNGAVYRTNRTSRLWDSTVGDVIAYTSSNTVSIGMGTGVTGTATLQVSGTLTVSTSSAPSSPSIYADSSGRVGLGIVPTASARLQVDDAGLDYSGTSPNGNNFGATFGATAKSYVLIGRYDGMPTIQGAGTGTSYGLYLNPSNGKVVIGNTFGNVGISNTSPKAKLDVWGSISASDAIQVGQSNYSCINAISGSIRFNTTSNTLQVCTDAGWTSLSSGTTATNTVTGSGSATAVAFWSGASGLTYDSGLYWDNTNKRLGVGTSTPTATLEVSGTGNFSGLLTANALASTTLQVGTGYGTSYIFMGDSGCGGRGGIRFGGAMGACTDYALSGDTGSTYLNAPTGGGINARINNNNYFTVRTTGVTVGFSGAAAGSQTLHVFGTALTTSWTGINFSSSGNVTATAPLEVSGTISSTAVSTTNISGTNIQVGQSGLTCGGGIAGAIRYNTTSNTLQICVGSVWTSLNSGTTPANTVTGSGSATAVAFWNGAAGLTYDDGFYYDDSNNRLGIGTNTPSYPLEISASNAGTYAIRVNVSNSSLAYFGPNQFGGSFVFGASNASQVTAGRGQLITSSGNTHLDAGTGSPLYLNYYNPTGYTLLQSSGGNVGVGTTVNLAPAAKLTVSGTFAVSGSGANPFLYVNSSGNTGIGTAAPTATLQVSGTLTVSTSSAPTSPSFYADSSGRVSLGAVPTASARLQVDDASFDYSGTTPNGNTFGATFGSSGKSYVLVGRYNGMPAIQGAGTGTSYGLYLNPANGKVVIGNTFGNVGISNTAPIAKLDIIGTVSASDAIQVGTSSLTCAASINGAIRYNAISNTIDVCVGTAWTSLNSGTTPANTVTGTGSATAVAFWNGANSITYDAGLYWDNTGKKIGVGTTTPTTALDVSGAGNFSGLITANALASTTLKVSAGYGSNYIFMGDSGCGGRGAIGFAAMGACTNYALSGDSTNTYLNAPTGGYVATRINNNAYFAVRSTGVTVGFTSATPSRTLHVLGTALTTSWTGINFSDSAAVTPTAPLEVSGTVSATRFVGDGSGLSNLPAATAASSTGAVQFNSNNALAGDTANFVYDNINRRLGIGGSGNNLANGPSATMYVAPGAINAVTTAGVPIYRGMVVNPTNGRNGYIVMQDNESLLNQPSVTPGAAAFGFYHPWDATNANAGFRVFRIMTGTESGSANTPATTMRDRFFVRKDGGAFFDNAVGVGTATPTTTLQVSGTFTVSSSGQTTSPSLYADSSGDVGIGTSNPTNQSNYGGLTIDGGNGSLIDLRYSGTNTFRLASSGALNFIQGMTNIPIAIYTNNLERMRVLGTGEVGIGTSTPAYPLDISASNTGTAAINVNVSNSSLIKFGPNQYGKSFVMGSTAANQSGANTGQLIISNGNITMDAQTAGTIYLNNYASTGKTVIQPNGGNVGIGTGSPAARLDVVSNTTSAAVARFENGTGACTFTPAASGSGTWSCTSDARLKTGIAASQMNALDYFGGLIIRDYTMKSDGSRQTGVIAQEVMKTHPELVHTDAATGFYTVDEPNRWLMVKAIQELKAENDNLKTEAGRLRSELRAVNDNLNRRLDALERRAATQP